MENSEIFKEWYLYTYLETDKNQSPNHKADLLERFFAQKWAEQWGVFLLFFDGVELQIEIFEYSKGDWKYTIECPNPWNESDDSGFKLRPDAQKPAVKKAFEILNKGNDAELK